MRFSLLKDCHTFFQSDCANVHTHLQRKRIPVASYFLFGLYFFNMDFGYECCFLIFFLTFSYF